MKPDKKALLAKLTKLRKSMAADRDAMREVVDEYESILDSCDRACDGLDVAIEALSEYL